MKKILLGLLFFGAGLSAQTKGNVEFGVNVGYNSSFISLGEESSDSGNGVNVGFSADYYFSDRWSIKAKLIYDQKGYNNARFSPDSYDPNYSSYNTNINANYLTVPLMANWHFGSKRNWYLNFGPYAGFLLNAKETTGGVDVSEAFKSNDFGFAYGIGVKVPLNQKLKIFFEFDGQSGFSDISANDNVTIENGRGAFNVGLNFMMK